ncbi:MAG TPA: hypothetical protein VGF75_04925 [Candidatus Saccharimonadales bacterium]|jgi:hypothetical protein
MKKQIKTKSFLDRYLASLGIGGMAVATVVGMLELGSQPFNRYVLAGQVVQVNNQNELNNPFQRENESSTVSYVSYSESQRTPARSGKY